MAHFVQFHMIMGCLTWPPHFFENGDDDDDDYDEDEDDDDDDDDDGLFV